jgi:hypothetical protein
MVNNSFEHFSREDAKPAKYFCFFLSAFATLREVICVHSSINQFGFYSFAWFQPVYVFLLFGLKNQIARIGKQIQVELAIFD